MRRSTKIVVLAALLPVLALGSGCASVGKSGVAGAAIGAVVGGIGGRNLGSALKGALVGAGVGVALHYANSYGYGVNRRIGNVSNYNQTVDELKAQLRRFNVGDNRHVHVLIDGNTQRAMKAIPNTIGNEAVVSFAEESLSLIGFRPVWPENNRQGGIVASRNQPVGEEGEVVAFVNLVPLGHEGRTQFLFSNTEVETLLVAVRIVLMERDNGSLVPIRGGEIQSDYAWESYSKGRGVFGRGPRYAQNDRPNAGLISGQIASLEAVRKLAFQLSGVSVASN